MGTDGQQVMQDDDRGDGWVTLAEAAGLLGVSVDTIRRRLRKGAFEAQQVPTQHGPAWMVRLGDVPTVLPTGSSTPRQDATTLELVHLVGRLQEENRNLAGQLGYVQAKLHQAEDTIRALEAPRSHQTATDARETAEGLGLPSAPSEPPWEPSPAPMPILPQPNGGSPWWRRWWRLWSGSEDDRPRRPSLPPHG